MTSKHSIFSNMTLLDWLLAAVFTLILAFLGNSLFPNYGWMIGILAALGLLYLAKHRRDQFKDSQK